MIRSGSAHNGPNATACDTLGGHMLHNKADHVELQDAINSMFRWYQNAAKCYVFLSDISSAKRKASSGLSKTPCDCYAEDPALCEELLRRGAEPANR